MSDASPATTLELTGNRSFTLNTAKGTRTLVCRRLTVEDWAAYFGAIYYTTQQVGRDLVQNNDVDSAKLLLADRVIVEAHGYNVDNDALQKSENWVQALPIGHRAALGDLLASIAVPDTDADEIHVGGTPVTLNAPWLTDDKGRLRVYNGLVHVLQSPSEAQFRRYKRAANETRVFGGSRAGTTQYVGGQMAAIALYDELIVSVEGYAVNGKPLEADLATIRSEMDALHKYVAVRQVFDPKTTILQPPTQEEEAAA